MSRFADDTRHLARTRREALGLLGAGALLPLVGCASDSGAERCRTIPFEGAGPFPADGTNGANALAMPGIVRGDIRSSLGDAAGVAEGVMFTLSLAVTGNDCEPLPGHAVYIWQCDRAGDYSMYTGGAVDESYLRGVQESDADGVVSFTSIVPGCYPGRWPHVHLEIFSSVAAATGGEPPVATSQLALPEAMCAATYATAGYEASASTFAPLSMSTDSAFSDGVDLQLATRPATLRPDTWRP